MVKKQKIPNTTLESSFLELTGMWFIWCKNTHLISPLEIFKPHHNSVTAFKSASGPAPVSFTLGPPPHSPARQPLCLSGASVAKRESSSSDCETSRDRPLHSCSPAPLLRRFGPHAALASSLVRLCGSTLKSWVVMGSTVTSKLEPSARVAS